MVESYQQSLFLGNMLTVLLLALYQFVSGLRRFMLFTDWRSDRSRLQASHGLCSNTWHYKKELLRSTRSRALLVFATLPFSSKVLYKFSTGNTGDSLQKGTCIIHLKSRKKKTRGSGKRDENYKDELCPPGCLHN